jgi:hypothetical protein
MQRAERLAQTAFAEFEIRIDPWAVDYGSETPTEFNADADENLQIDASVERDVGKWSAVVPAQAELPEQLAIVDGVRRIEARLVVTRAGRIVHGALGAYGVGVVHCQSGHASFGDELRGRVVIFGAGESPPAPITVSPGLVYASRSVPEDDPEAPLRGLHREMRAVEEQFARKLATNAEILVLADGPLSISDPTAGRVVGFVKRLFKLYLAADQLPVLRALPRGARTPVFLIRSAGRFSRYSWFTRIAARLPVESDFTGLVRLEVSEAVGIGEAIRLADMTTSVVPRFVPSRSRDPRAPQNLVPIGALEQHLRRGLGDARLIHRRLATLLAREFVNA